MFEIGFTCALIYNVFALGRPEWRGGHVTIVSHPLCLEFLYTTYFNLKVYFIKNKDLFMLNTFATVCVLLSVCNILSTV